MKTQRPKLKTTPCPSFSCGFFRHCTQTVLSPTTSHPPTLPVSQSHAPPPPPPPPLSSHPPTQQPPLQESESSSSSNTSQSFTQWRFTLPNSPISYPAYPPPESEPFKDFHPNPPPPPPVVSPTDLQELFHVAELQLSSGVYSDRAKALHMLERSLVPNPPTVDGGGVDCPAAVMRGVVGNLKERAGAKAATKVLLALCLAEGSRRVAVEVGAVGEVVEALADLEGPAAERAAAALELLCTVAEGEAELRAHALAVPMLVEVMGKTAARGREYAISALAVLYGGTGKEGMVAPPDAVASAVALAMQGDCSARGRRKGAQLLRTLQENGRLDLTHHGQ